MALSVPAANVEVAWLAAPQVTGCEGGVVWLQAEHNTAARVTAAVAAEARRSDPHPRPPPDTAAPIAAWARETGWG